MNNSKKGTAFLKEFKDFIAFLQSLWGVLAGLTVLFPMSNLLMKTIPIEPYGTGDIAEGGLKYVSPDLLTGVATVISLFIIFWTYGQRQEIKSRMEMYSIRRQAIFSFAFGFMALVIYLFFYLLTSDGFWGNEIGWENSLTTIAFALSDIVSLSSYSAFFALVTRAFMLLGMIEYFEKS